MEENSVDRTLSEASDDVSQLRERIAALKEDATPTPSFGSEFHLVFSLGFVVVGSIALGAYVGKRLAQHYHQPALETVAMLMSIGLAALSVYGLLRPVLRKRQ